MNNLKNKLHLQLFAEGTGGEGAPGEGVGNEAAGNAGFAAQQQVDDGQLTTDNGEGADLDAEFKALIKGKYKEQYENHFKGALKDRTKKNTNRISELETEVNAAKPVLDILKARYGIDDVNALGTALEEDSLYIQHQAMETGKSEADILADIRKNRQAQEEARKRAADIAELESYRADAQLKKMIDGWREEAKKLQEIYPDFDLDTEYKNKAFADMLYKGFDLKFAYEGIHHAELLEKARKETAQTVERQTIDTIASGAARPSENGVTSQAAAQTTVDVNSLTSKDVLDIIKKVENGQRITFER